MKQVLIMTIIVFGLVNYSLAQDIHEELDAVVTIKKLSDSQVSIKITGDAAEAMFNSLQIQGHKIDNEKSNENYKAETVSSEMLRCMQLTGKTIPAKLRLLKNSKSRSSCVLTANER